jgi:hypothetical protein
VHVDAQLPMPPSPVEAPPPPAPADRQELLALLTQIGSQCRMPPGLKQAQFVRLPAALFQQVHDVMQRELAALAAQSQA